MLTCAFFFFKRRYTFLRPTKGCGSDPSKLYTVFPSNSAGKEKAIETFMRHYMWHSEYLYNVLEPSEMGMTFSILDFKGQ